MEVANQEKLDGLRVQLSEMTRRMTNVEYVMSHVKSEMEALKELDRYSRDPPARSEPYTSPTTSSLSQGDVQDKLKSLAILTSSVRSAVSRIEREVHGMALNTTQLMQNLSYLQRNAPTKQFINSALLGLKNQAQIYPTMTGAVTGSGEFIWSPGNGAIAGQWMNQSVATNCKYTPRKFGINRIQLFGVGSVKDPFFVNCFDGWTVSSFLILVLRVSVCQSELGISHKSSEQFSLINIRDRIFPRGCLAPQRMNGNPCAG